MDVVNFFSDDELSEWEEVTDGEDIEESLEEVLRSMTSAAEEELELTRQLVAGQLGEVVQTEMSDSGGLVYLPVLGAARWCDPMPPTAEEAQWLRRATAADVVEICFSNRHVSWPLAALTVGRCDLYDQLADDQLWQIETHPMTCGFRYIHPDISSQVQAAAASGKLAPVKFVIERFQDRTASGRKRKRPAKLSKAINKHARTFEQAEYLSTVVGISTHLTEAAFCMDPAEGLKTLELIVGHGQKLWKEVLNDGPDHKFQFRDALVGKVLAQGVKWPLFGYRHRQLDVKSLMVMVKHQCPAARDPKYIPIFRCLKRRRAAVSTALATKLTPDLVSRILVEAGLALHGSGQFE